jgi:hypothetical protein
MNKNSLEACVTMKQILALATCLLSLALAAPARETVVLTVPAQEKQDQHASEAAQALAAVDEILQQVSHITGLPIKQKVQGQVVTREQIRDYIAQRMKDTTTSEQMHAQEAALIKFGLLPPGFRLEKFLVDLLAEQATAFYDPKTKRIFLSDWAPLEIQKPAIAHELTHALQDQHTSLDVYMENKTMSQDEEAARQAVVEGEGVLAMMDYMLAPMGTKAADMPNLPQIVESATAAETAKFPVFGAAPVYLKEGLLFPYTFGLVYTQAKSKTYGADVYGALLDHPPRSTHEIMHPDAPSTPPLELQAPDVPAAARAGYKKLDSNVLGELDIFILLKQTLSEAVAKAVSPSWRGFRYDVYENAAGQVLLAHRSQWKDANSAEAFGEAYRRVIAKKAFPGEDTRVEVHRDTVDVLEGIHR